MGLGFRGAVLQSVHYGLLGHYINLLVYGLVVGCQKLAT